MRAISMLGAALVAAAPVPAHAAGAPAPAPQAISPAAPEVSLVSLDSGPFRADAMRLASLAMPRDGFVAMMETSLISGFRIGLKRDGGNLEKNAPGITADFERTIISAARPLLPEIHDKALHRYARLFSRELNVSETAELVAFFGSPLGQKLIARKFNHLATNDWSGELLGKEQTTDSDIRAVNREIGKSLAGDLTAEDVPVLLTLMTKPVFKKMRALQPIVDRLEADQANEQHPGLEAAIDNAVQQVLARHQKRD